MKPPACFDRVALPYRFIEYFSFGPYLRQCRALRIAEMSSFRRALIYGDGDGRFLALLARSTPAMEITAVDASRAMLRLAARRLPPQARVRLVHADALTWEPAGSFDLVVSHFFLDCFDEEELAVLASRVNRAIDRSAVWVVSDFAIPRQRWARLPGRLLVSGLYLAFGVLTGLQTRRLPDHARILRDAGWEREDRRERLFGLLISERWRRAPD